MARRFLARSGLSRPALAAAALAVGASSALAQTASQITPQSFRPNIQTQGGASLAPEPGSQEAPAGAEKTKVRVGRVRFEGSLPDLASETNKIAVALSGRFVTAAEIFAAARELERAYSEAGYALVRVVVPAQKIVNGGDVRLVVVDGYIDRVDTSGLPPAIRGRVEALLEGLVGQQGLRRSVLERALLLAGDTPGVALASAIGAGEKTGTSTLSVEARYKPVTGQLTVDNTLSTALGTRNYGMGLDVNSALGYGELLYFRASGSPYTLGRAEYFSDNPLNRVFAGGVVAPIGPDGLTLNIEATSARATPRAAPGALELTSTFTRLSTRLRYPLLRTRDLTINAAADFDVTEEDLRAIRPIAAPISLDRLRIARAGADLTWITPIEGTITARLISSFGIDGLGARGIPTDPEATPLSRQGSRPEFQKTELTLGINQPLLTHVTLDLKARGQLSWNQALPRSEQIGLANQAALSSFDSGLFQGDEGFVVRGELQFPFALPFTLPFGLASIPEQQGRGLPDEKSTPGTILISPYGFGAFGQLHDQNPTAVERSWVRAVSYGGGIRFGAIPTSRFGSISASLEYGRQQRSDRQPVTDRFTFAAALQW